MKKCSLLFSSFVCFTVLPELLLSLPKGPSVVAGDVTIKNQHANTMVIEASDKSIVNYKSFDIHKGEKVQFIQPSSSSTVLNRVQGDKASRVLGQIESNGRVVLINPNGMYFGPHASVRVGSLIASALDISNDDFIKDQYSFLLKDKDYLAEVRNDGLLAASPEGAIVLMAPIVRNFGTIQARAGKVVVASGEKVTLDFHGDGLLNFSVEGDLKGAVIEHLGHIQAEGGEVSLHLPTARRAIHEVINRDGVERGEVFVKENGEIFLVSASSILAKKVSLEGSSLSVDGHIDVSNSLGKGGEISVLGAEINLRGARMDASGLIGGGRVLIGGEYQGGGSTPYASTVSMDSSSHILANAIDEGSGGSVVLWSLNQTEFEGNVFAQGGFHSGNGGIVETSSIEDLHCLSGSVNTSAPSGTMGQWLLDPTELSIVSGSSSNPPLCTGGLVGVDAIKDSTSTVVLCANIINQNVPITMTEEESGLFFRAPAGAYGLLNLDGGDITTKEGTIIVQDLAIVVKVNTALDTTGVGAHPVGASISLNTVNSELSIVPKDITLKAGLSRVEVGNMGAVNALGTVTINADTAAVQSIITDNSPIIIAASTLLKGNAVFNTGLGAGNVTLREVNALIAGDGGLVISAGSGSVTMGGVGTDNPLSGFSILSAAPSVVVGNIVTQNGGVVIVPSFLLRGEEKLIVTSSDLNPLLSGDVTLGDVEASSVIENSLSIRTGLKGSVTTGNLGTEEVPIGALTITTNQPLFIKDVYADTLTINGHSGDLELLGAISLSGSLNISGAGVLLGGAITAANVSILARDAIANITAPNPITGVTPGVVVLNAAGGSLGTAASPIEINTSGPVTVGGDAVHADLIGTTQKVKYVAGNKPCILRFRGVDFPCSLGILATFNASRTKTLRNFFYANDPAVLLGLQSPDPYRSKGIQHSSFDPLVVSSDSVLPDLGPFSVVP